MKKINKRRNTHNLEAPLCFVFDSVIMKKYSYLFVLIFGLHFKHFNVERNNRNTDRLISTLKTNIYQIESVWYCVEYMTKQKMITN